MEIIEERVRLNGEEFTKSEIREIASFVKLDSDGLTYIVDVNKTLEQEIKGRKVMASITRLIRLSSPMQRALKAKLFDSPTKGRVIVKSELRRAISLYKKG